MNKVYYSQADSKWANYPYPSKTYPKATIKSSGCGPTSSAMIISSMVTRIYPNEMARLFLDNGLRAPTGTSHDAFRFIANRYGLNMKKSIYIDDAVKCLENGGMCVAYCKAGGLFSTGGHIIVLAGVQGKNLIVYDPYLYKNKFSSGKRKCVTVRGNECIVSIANFKKYCDYTLYCYEYKENPYKQGEFVEVHIPVQLTGAKSGRLVMVDTEGYQYWVNESVIKDGKIIARAQIAFAEETRCIIQIFKEDPQFWCDNKYIVKKL